jgi:hypothetical protein
MSDLNDLINGRLGPELENFTKDQEKLSEKIGEVQGKIDGLNAKQYLTDEQKEELIGLHGDMDELKGQYTANADAHAEATKRILFDLIAQRAAIDGLSDAEFDMLENIAYGMGLIDKATLESTRVIDKAMKDLAKPGAGLWDVQTALTIQLNTINNIRDALNGLDGRNVTYSVTGQYSQTGNVDPNSGMFFGSPAARPPAGGTGTIRGGQFEPGGAHGLNMIVPPGYPNDSFRVRATSGETVTITPPGQSSSPINITINGNIERDNIYTLARAVGAELQRQSRYN